MIALLTRSCMNEPGVSAPRRPERKLIIEYLRGSYREEEKKEHRAESAYIQ